MEDILQPAIDYGNNGFPVSEVIAYEMASSYEGLKDRPGFAQTYIPAGRPPVKGEVFVNQDLANTYQLIAKEGRDVFIKVPLQRL